MSNFKVGMLTDGFKLDLRSGIAKAASLGAKGVQVYAVEGEMHYSNLSAQARKDLLHYTQDQGLVFSALCGDPGGHGFAVKEENPARVEMSKRILDLALDLECNVVTTHIGCVPETFDNETYEAMASACGQMSEYANSVGGHFAIETGPEPSDLLRRFLDTLPGKGVGVNFDPANLAMVIGEDIPQAVRNLGPYIVHTHAKDGRMLRKGRREVIYGVFAEEGIESLGKEPYFIETPLGQGSVPWKDYLAALEEVGYHGFLTIERELGADPAADMAMAVGFLENLIG